VFSPMPQMNEVQDLDLPDRQYPVIQGDYSGQAGLWTRKPVVAGTVIPAPSPIFTKLDDDMVENELARMNPDS